MDVLARGQRPSDIITTRGAGERDRGRRDERRLDQRRPAPARRRQRGRRRRSTSTTSTASPRRRRCCATSSPAAATSPPTSTRPAASASSLKRLLEAGLLHERRADRHRPDDRRARRARPRRPTARRSCARSTNPLKPTGGLAILRGNLAPEGCVVKLSGHERVAPQRPGARVRVRGGRDGRGHERRDRAGDVVVIRNEGPAGGPGMREMLARHRRARRRGARRQRRAAHRRPLLRRHPRLHGRPRRPRGRAAAARSRRSATATRSRSTSTNRALDVDLSDEEIAERVAAYEAPAAGATRNGVLAKYAKLVVERLRGRRHALTPRDAGLRRRARLR